MIDTPRLIESKHLEMHTLELIYTYIYIYWCRSTYLRNTKIILSRIESE